MRKDIFDEMGRIIGYTIKNGNITTIFDNMGRVLGNHNEVTNNVVNNMGKIVGKGLEMLGVLIKL